MTETKPKSRAMALAAAARIAGFDAALPPGELCDVSLACLLAEIDTCQHGNDAGLWLDMIDVAIKSGDLLPARYKRADDTFVLCLRGGWHYLTRDAVVAWLRKIDETPGELARAWLGDAWQEQAPKVSDDKAPNAAADATPDAATGDPDAIRCGSNPARIYRAWIAERATKLREAGDTFNTLGERIRKEAKERNYYNQSGDPIPLGTIIKAIPEGTTGGRGKNGRKPKKLIRAAKSS